MRKRRGWTASDVDKLKTMAGKHPVDRIAEELGWRPAAVKAKAYQLKLSLGFHRHRRRRAKLAPRAAGMDRID